VSGTSPGRGKMLQKNKCLGKENTKRRFGRVLQEGKSLVWVKTTGWERKGFSKKAFPAERGDTLGNDLGRASCQRKNVGGKGPELLFRNTKKRKGGKEEGVGQRKIVPRKKRVDRADQG